MKSFVIKELAKDFNSVALSLNINGFSYKLKNNNSLKVKEIIIVNKDIINGLISYNFDKKYKKILECYFNLLQDEDDDTDEKLMLALDEIARLRSILIKRFNKHLSKKIEEKLLKKLKILENEIRTKIIDFKLIKEAKVVNNNISEEKMKSR